MATTVATYPGSTSAVARTSATTWTNTGNIVSDNATDATCNNTSGNGSYYLVASNFGFNLSSLATIRGITVVVQASEHSTGTEVLNAQLQNDSGNLFGGSKTATISGTAKVNYTYGSTSDAWSATLTPAIVNDPDFGVRVWFATSHDVRIDFIRVTIEYGEGIQPPLGTLTLEGFAPTITQEVQQNTFPGAGTVTAEGYAPTVERTFEDVRVSYARLNVTSVDVRVSYARADVAQTGAISVVPPPGLLTLTEPAPTVVRVDAQWITAGAAATAVEGYAPTAVNGESQGIITLSAVDLPMNGFAPALTQTRNVFTVPGAGEVTVTGPVPSVSFSGFVTPDAGAVTVAGHAPTAQVDTALLLAAPSTLTVQGYTPNLQSGTADVRISWARLDTQSGTRTIGAGTITVTGYPPAIGAIVIGGGGYRTLTWEPSADPGVTGYWIYWDVSSRGNDAWQDYRYSVWVPGRTTDSYTVTSLVPGQMYYFNMSSDDGTHGAYESELVGEFNAEAFDGGLVASGHAPVVEQTTNVLRVPGAGTVTAAGFAPSLDVTAGIGAGTVTAAGFAPVPAVTENQWRDIGIGTTTVVGYPVTLETETLNAPVVKTGEITAEGFAPRVDNNSALAIGLGEITAEGFAPDVAITAEKIIFSGLGAVTAEGFALAVATTAAQWVTFDTATAGTLEGFAPGVLESGAFSLVPGAAAVAVTGYEPTVAQHPNLFVVTGDSRLSVVGWAPTLSGTELQPSGGMLTSWMRPIKRRADEREEGPPEPLTIEQEPELLAELARVRERKERREAHSSNVVDPAVLELRVYEALLVDQLMELERQRAAIEAENESAMMLLLLLAA